MTRRFPSLSKTCLGLLVLGLLGGLPSLAEAAGIGFRNDLNFRVIVQGASSVNNVVRRGQPLIIEPGKTLWDTNLPDGNREVIIYGGQPNRILHRSIVPFQGQDMTLYVSMDRTGRVRLSEKANP